MAVRILLLIAASIFGSGLQLQRNSASGLQVMSQFGLAAVHGAISGGLECLDLALCGRG